MSRIHEKKNAITRHVRWASARRVCFTFPRECRGARSIRRGKAVYKDGGFLGGSIQ